tara:strand:- start:1560 stop:2645 length:1086 start_codon:yes stop_codon:yes gene_type:complete
MNLARSPYIIEISETGQTGSKIELFLWNTGSQPASPEYTLDKKIPASNNVKTFYNISPYVREFFTFTTFQNIYNTYDTAINTDFVVQYAVKKYKEVNGTFTLLSTETGLFMDGFGYYMEGANPGGFTKVGLDEGTYLYNYDSSLPTSQANAMAGTIDVNFTDVNEFIRYTNLRTGVVTNIAFSTLGLRTFPRVHHTNLADGNKTELTRGGSVRWTATFEKQCEPKYQPVIVDFINKYGSWSRVFFQKAKRRNIDVKTDSYKSNPASIPYTATAQGQVREFNTTGKETITLNTGFVNDGYAEYIQQLLLSEKVTLLDYENDTQYTPVIVKTKSLEKQTGLNDGTMNYTLDFEFAFDIINNVI